MARILLINANTYRTPPVIPVGLEYVGSSLSQAGHDVTVLDLCFADDCETAVQNATDDLKPDLIGITIRNIDSALYNNNVFFIPEIKNIVQFSKRSGAPVVLGGAGFSATPEIILDETGADYGVKGPGEKAARFIADAIDRNETPDNKIINGWHLGIVPHFVPERPFGIDYEKYLSNRGLAGFATQYGCCEACPYCIEAGTTVIHRNPDAVIREIASLVETGVSDFHLCDSEYNLDLDFSELFASRLANSLLNIKWSLYIKPSPWSNKMFDALKLSGATTITMSVDSYILSGSNQSYNFDDIKNIIRKCRDLEIKLAIDLITGSPNESELSTANTIDFFKEYRPDAVGVNSFFRVYPGTEFEKEVKGANLSLIDGDNKSGPSRIAPVFYSKVSTDMLHEMIGGDTLFKIEGFERTSNYERLK